jgi:hypothetical protein
VESRYLTSAILPKRLSCSASRGPGDLPSWSSRHFSASPEFVDAWFWMSPSHIHTYIHVPAQAAAHHVQQQGLLSCTAVMATCGTPWLDSPPQSTAASALAGTILSRPVPEAAVAEDGAGMQWGEDASCVACACPKFQQTASRRGDPNALRSDSTDSEFDLGELIPTA